MSSNISFQKIINAQGPDCTKAMDTEALLENYACRGLFAEGEIRLSYWEVDRTVVGGVIPTGAAIEAPCPDFLAASYLCERRELGVLNLGGKGSVKVDGTLYELETKDALYVSRGSEKISFESADPSNPAQFYLLSYPAHTAHPTTHIKVADIEPLELGTPEDANERSLYKMICPGVVESCQLVMGITTLKSGSVWNTMPPHTHARRSEVYLYFELPNDRVVMHFMGKIDQTRHMVLRQFEAALSPNWSIHAGAGTGAYSFVWGMGGENQEFTDMDMIALKDLS